ncbi:hypothetical protein D9V32_14065 [Mycetocola tolaasinivorans]|uniref:Uncharacterized protein n=1 Tax=Mycetocola tolaasinivorans TaxID=76635 RepID=A0A3L7A302_9MICO|nr:hypothetical protein D9V32_14065 [Mycetocola tolaasinivorans]
MDERFTYLLMRDEKPLEDIRVTVWAPVGVVPALTLPMMHEGTPAVAVLLDHRALTCSPVAGVRGECGSAECHRRVLGACQCGRHPEGPRLARAS